MHISIEYRGVEHFSRVTGHYFQVTPSEINASVTKAVHNFLQREYPHREILSDEIVIKEKSALQQPTITKPTGERK